MNSGHLTGYLTTVQQHILDQQRVHPTATGRFSWVLSGITLATKIIEAQVRRAGVMDVLGETGESNVQGEQVKKLDEIANETLMRCLGYRDDVGIMVSEEEEEPRILKESPGEGRYVVLFDPLDGSSNIDVNVSVGTIFSVFEMQYGLPWGSGPEAHVLQPGVKQLAAAKGEGYSQRYIGSMVADFHRTLLKGGVFLYPETEDSPNGKLRLMYEANPMAFLAEQAGGAATDDRRECPGSREAA